MSFRCLRWAAFASVMACSGGGAQEQERSMEVYSWWTNTGERAAVAKLIEYFNEQHPKTKVTHTGTAPASALTQLTARMATGEPPDTFLTLGGGDLLRWVLTNDRDASESVLEPLSAAVASSGIANTLPNVVRNAVSHAGELYCVPLDVVRTNVLFYNTRVLAGNQLEPPTSLAELDAVSKALQAKGLVPLAISTQDGTVLSQMLFDGLLIAQAGVNYRDSFLSGKEDPADPRVAAAITELDALLAYTNEDRDGIGWPAAARRVIEGSAAMTLAGDGAKSFFMSAGLKPGVDFGEIPFPGTQGVFVFLVDCFTLPRGVRNRAATLDFLQVIATREAHAVFNFSKGSISARLDLDRAGYDALGQQTVADFRSNTLTLGRSGFVRSADFLAELDSTLRQFARTRNVTSVVNMLRNRYDQL